jgi:predicted MFS family arabinose efflux permease
MTDADKQDRTRFTASPLYCAYVLALLVSVGIAGWVDRNVLAALLQSIKLELAFSDTELGLLGGIAFGVFYAAVGLPIAWLADRSDRRSLIAVAVGVWSVMTAACGLAGGFPALFLARVGVGIGEAGGSPSSQSLVSDYFGPERRARAFGVLYLQIPLGFVVGYWLGGWLDGLVGWRLTFMLVGLPGVALALLVRLTLREPPRGHADVVSPAEAASTSLASTIRFFVAQRPLRYLSLAGAAHGIGAFAAALWLPAYFMRTFAVTGATAGAWLALAYGCGGTAGVLCGGQIADALVRNTQNARWYAWGGSAVIAATLPCTALTYLADAPAVAVAALIVATFLGHMFLGPVAALLQNLAGVHRRAMVAAFYLFLVNLVSMGVGPTAVGLASDRFAASFGSDALRWALFAVVTVSSVVASALFWFAGRSVPRDLRGEEQDGQAPALHSSSTVSS